MTPLFWLILLLSIPAAAENTLLTEQKLAIINAGEPALLNGEWEKSFRQSEYLLEIDSADPSGYLIRAAAMQGEMMDAEENLYGERYLEILDSVKSLAERKLQACSRHDSAACYLFIGHAYAYRSLWEARFASNYSAITYGFKARSQYHKGLAVDSTLYDLYFGIGSYHYWKSVKAGFFRAVGLFKNDKAKGIRELQLAIDSSLFSRESARASLIWVWINEKQYDSAIALASGMLQKYPAGNSFLWPLAEAFYKSRQYDSALAFYSRLFDRLKSRPGNFFNLIESAYWAIQSLDRLDRKKEGAAYQSFIQENYPQIPRHIKRKQKSKLAAILRHQ
ncbi:MAG: hypothetical protein AB1690_11620 [Candidatus Zixiibacteriota bacterium]